MQTAIRTERTGDARAAMERRGVDLLALAPSDDLRYLLGFAPTADERPCLLLLDPEQTLCVVPALNAAQLEAAVPELETLAWADEEGPRPTLARALAALPAPPRRVAVDATMRADALLLLQTLLPDSEYVSSTEILAPLRMRKSADELARLRASARTADAAMRAAFAACHAGATELEVAEAVAGEFRRQGCEGVSFAIVAGGPNGAFPHHHSGDRRFADGDPIVIDIGSTLDGYASDITRMVHLGPPSDHYREVHDAVERAVQAALGAARPGASCADVDAAARAVIDDAGYGRYFTHRTGHGLGLSGHEPPSIMAGEETVLGRGMVFSIEPGIYLPGQFGVRLEEIVATTDAGCEILSSLGRDLAGAR